VTVDDFSWGDPTSVRVVRASAFTSPAENFEDPSTATANQCVFDAGIRVTDIRDPYIPGKWRISSPR